MLIGEYTHSQDDKKRISLPAKFKKEIGKKVVITHGLDNCLFMFGIKEWVKISEKLGSLSMGQASSRGFNRMFLGGAVEVDVDSVGRILIPDFLREFAGLSDKVGKVVFTGVYNKVEIWDELRWKNYKMENLKHVDDIAEKLGEFGVI
jgi:MraZ protein